MLENQKQIRTGVFIFSWKEWVFWLKNIPFSFKWFVFLLLFKPIIDAFYFIKDSGLLSPSQLIGFLSFILFLYFIISKKQKDSFSIATLFFSLFSILLILNNSLVYLISFNIQGIGEFIRNIVPVFLFFFLRNEIRSLDDINGLITTFLFSSIFPFSVYIYEYIFVPIQVIELSEGRGGGLRLTGIYADMFNYMSYIVGNFLLILVVTTNSIYTNIQLKLKPFILILALTILGLLGIKHQASWGVFFALFLIFILSNLYSKKGKKIILLIFVGSIFVLPSIWKENITPLYSKEIRAYKSEINQDRALNGRIIRWKKYFDYWSNMSVEAKLFGVSLSNHKAAPIMMSGGMHSDYIRFLFSTGIIGLLFYLLFYVFLIIKSFVFPVPIRIFILFSSTSFLLYAISSNPFGASGALMYILVMGLVISEKPKSLFIES